VAEPQRDTSHPGFREGRDALLDATLRVVARDGFDGLTYRAVAKEAGTTHGLVSYHFGSREALVHEAAAKASRQAVDGAALMPEGAAPEDFVRDLSASVERDLHTHLFQYEMALQSRRRPDLGREIAALYEEYFDITRQALRRMGIAEATPALARFVFAAIDGIVLQHVVRADPQRTDEAVAVLHGFLRGLIGAPEPPLTFG
jgi:AcrR family transcriptional regulator